jgi:hypothetical protein
VLFYHIAHEKRHDQTGRKVALWVRVHAAEQKISVSQFVGELLKERMIEEETYYAAMRQYLSKPKVLIKESVSKYPNRDMIYER